MSLVLLPEELFELTGFKRPGKQIAWLKKNGFKFRLNRMLHPKVDRGHYEGRMGAGPAVSVTQPNWDAINKPKPNRKEI